MTGMRKPSVLPVPVFACAMLGCLLACVLLALQRYLCNCLHVDAAQGLVDGASLDIRHCLELHLPGDGVDNVGMYQPEGREIGKPCDWLRLPGQLLSTCVCLRSNLLLPLCAVVEARQRGPRQVGRRRPQRHGRGQKRPLEGPG